MNISALVNIMIPESWSIDPSLVVAFDSHINGSFGYLMQQYSGAGGGKFELPQYIELPMKSFISWHMMSVSQAKKDEVSLGIVSKQGES
jgi:hypothetical protein